MKRLFCFHCKQPIPWEACNTQLPYHCQFCNKETWASVFPSFFSEEIKLKVENRLEESSPCFYHTEKKASEVCQSCGAFICTLCDFQIGKEHWCPKCLEKGAKDGKIKNLENQRVLHDNIVLALALLPYTLIFWFATFITTPISIFLTLRNWKSPMGILHKTRWRFVLAMVLNVISAGTLITIIFLASMY